MSGQYKVDLLGRYISAFGFLAKRFSTLGVGISHSGIYANINTYTVDDSEFDEIILRANGIELKFGAMPFVGGNYGVLAGLLGKKELAVGDIFAPPPMLSFSRQKNINETPIEEGDGVVVEYYGLQPWSVKIQGLLIDMDEHSYPHDREKQLNKLFEYAGRVDVVGDLFANKGIDSIYFTSIDIEGIEGYEDTVKYTLLARSIKPVEFELNK